MTDKDYCVGGCTALIDAIGGAIHHMGNIHKYDRNEMEEILKALSDSENQEYGFILRAKGIVPDTEGGWIYFDLTPEEYEIRSGQPDVTGKLCVIGSGLQEDKISKLFHA